MATGTSDTEHITTEFLIRLAGLSDGPEFEERNGKAVGLALQRLRNIRLPIEREMIYNELAALHMPELVEAFKKQRAVNGAAEHLLIICSGRPHFIRYAKFPEAQDLHNLHAQRLLAGVWNEGWSSFEFELTYALQFLSTFLVVWGTDFDKETNAKLVQQIRKWKNELPHVPGVQDYAGRCLDILDPVGANRSEMHRIQLPFVRKVISKGVESCNLTGCTSTTGTLMACSKCKLKYCSVEHQRRDWKEHKPFCVTPAF